MADELKDDARGQVRLPAIVRSPVWELSRRLILARAHDAASAGFQVGYESPSQFSREYSRLFGAPPLRDVARLRGASAADAA